MVGSLVLFPFFSFHSLVQGERGKEEEKKMTRKKRVCVGKSKNP